MEVGVDGVSEEGEVKEHEDGGEKEEERGRGWR